VQDTTKIAQLDCVEVWKQLVDYMEGDVTPELYRKIEEHLIGCRHCTAVYDGVRNVVLLLGEETSVELPQGFSQRLYQHLVSRLVSDSMPAKSQR
jgi:predicted anti-sigma-YlaC factor YlaD